MCINVLCIWRLYKQTLLIDFVLYGEPLNMCWSEKELYISVLFLQVSILQRHLPYERDAWADTQMQRQTKQTEQNWTVAISKTVLKQRYKMYLK